MNLVRLGGVTHIYDGKRFVKMSRANLLSAMANLKGDDLKTIYNERGRKQFLIYYAVMEDSKE